MSGEQERDARLFLEDVFGPQPAGLIAITIAPKWHIPHCVKTPADALHYVVDKRDVYFRIGLVAHRPAKRGEEADTISIPGVWVEVDVNGGPKSNGKVVTAGAPSVEAAMQLAHSVLQPTVMVRSGYGLHAYWLFREPWRFENDEERARAKRLVQGWQARLRQAARERGIDELDSTHDLSRVLRVPGSMNGKAQEPAAVRLLDDGGPRYERDQIAAEVIEIDDEPHTDTASDGPGRPVDELLSEFPRLARIARREGNAPGDGSGHMWDFYLCCEGVRCGCDDSELAALIEHNRKANGDPRGKGDRGDYIAGTIRRARDTVGTEAASGPAERISKRWNLGADPIVSGSSLGNIASGEAIIYLHRRSGKRLRFPSLGDLFEQRKHTRVVSTVTRSRFAPLSNAEAVDIGQLVIELCGGDDKDPHEEARQWVIEFIAGAGATVDAFKADGTAKTQWEVLEEYEQTERLLPRSSDAAGRGVIIRKGEELWLPAGRLKEHSGSRMAWDQFENRLSEIGWRKEELDRREPTTREKRAAARRVHRSFYVGTD